MFINSPLGCNYIHNVLNYRIVSVQATAQGNDIFHIFHVSHLNHEPAIAMKNNMGVCAFLESGFGAVGLKGTRKGAESRGETSRVGDFLINGMSSPLHGRSTQSF